MKDHKKLLEDMRNLKEAALKVIKTWPSLESAVAIYELREALLACHVEDDDETRMTKL
jgi:hypothetical protein